MLKEFYKSLPSFPEEKFEIDDELSESILNSLRDPICLNIPNIFSKDSPAECKRCSQVLCSKCVELIVKSDAKCPNCREYLQVRKMNRYLKYIMSNLKLRCHLHLNGCTVALPLEELLEHENNCDFESIQCPKKCGQVFMRKNLNEHLKTECPLEKVPCPFLRCNVKIHRNQLEKHKKECLRRHEIQSTDTSRNNEESKGFEQEEIILSYDDSDPIPEKMLDSDKLSNQTAGDNFWEVRLVNSNNTPDNKIVLSSKTTSLNSIDSKQGDESIFSYKIEPCVNKKFGCNFCGNKSALLAHELKCKYTNAVHQRKRIYSEQIPLSKLEDTPVLLSVHSECHKVKAGTALIHAEKANSITNC